MMICDKRDLLCSQTFQEPRPDFHGMLGCRQILLSGGVLKLGSHKLARTKDPLLACHPAKGLHLYLIAPSIIQTPAYPHSLLNHGQALTLQQAASFAPLKKDAKLPCS